MQNSYFSLIIFFVAGFLMWILRSHKNRIIGYRTPRSIKSRKNFEFANRVAGISLMIFSPCYLFIRIAVNEFTKYDLVGLPGLVVIVIFFLSLIGIIEWKLKKEFN